MFRKLTDDFYVAPQLQAEDFAKAEALGIKTVINNRPDGEAPDQLSHESARQRAEAANLAYHFVPVVSGGIFPDHVAQFAEVVDKSDGPILAYCRSGTRSTFLWSMQAARTIEPEVIVETASKAGYDVSSVRPMLDEINKDHRSKDQS